MSRATIRQGANQRIAKGPRNCSVEKRIVATAVGTFGKIGRTWRVPSIRKSRPRNRIAKLSAGSPSATSRRGASARIGTARATAPLAMKNSGI